MIVMLKDDLLEHSFLLIEWNWNDKWINQRRNQEVQLRGLMWKEPIKWWLKWQRRRMLYANKKKIIKIFAPKNILNWNEERNELWRCFIEILEETSSKSKLCLIAQMDDHLFIALNQKIFYDMMKENLVNLKWNEIKWSDQRNSHSLTISVNFRWTKHIRKLENKDIL